jgi:hypothetical protein
VITDDETIGNLVDPLYRGITARYVRKTEGRSVAGMIHDLRALGTTPPAGVSGRTWRRLRAEPDRNVTPATFNALRAAQRRLRLTGRREAILRSPRPGIEIKADVLVSSVLQKGRTLHVGTWPDSDIPGHPPITGMLGPVLDAWLAGDDDAAADALIRPASAGMGGHGVKLDNVEFVRLGQPGDRPGWSIRHTD